MKELIIKKGEQIKVYVYQDGKCIEKFTLKLNCNLQPIRVSPDLTHSDSINLMDKNQSYEKRSNEIINQRHRRKLMR